MSLWLGLAINHLPLGVVGFAANCMGLDLQLVFIEAFCQTGGAQEKN